MKLKLYNPTQPQKDFHQLVNVDKPLISVLVAGRQTGKTFFMQNDAVMRCLNTPKQRVWFVSPIQAQSNKVMKDIEAMFSAHQELFNQIIVRFDRKNNEIYFHNGSFLKFKSADSGDNLRGATLDMIYLDEAAYMKLDLINAVLLPMITRTNGRVIAASTFNGPNWFYDWFTQGQDSDNWEDMKSIKKTYLDLNDPEVTKVVMGVKKSMTKSQFDQEYMCLPVSAGVLFSNMESSMSDEVVTDYERVYIGMDIGVAQDYTVMTAMTEDFKVIDIHRFNYKEEDLDYQEFKQRIRDFYFKHDDKLAACYFEVNNNDLLFDDLTEKEDMYKMIPFLTTAKSKPDMIRNLVKLFEDKKIMIPRNNELLKELYDFKSKRNAITGNLQFQNTEGKHDDMVMSLAIAAYCAFEEQDGGVTMFL
jgi:hypothetical protein